MGFVSGAAGFVNGPLGTFNDSELEGAATRLQAIQRGRAARKQAAVRPKAMPTTVKYTSDYDEKAAAAAVKVQAMQRGRSARKASANAALTYGASDQSERKALKKRNENVASYKIGYCEAHGRGPQMANFGNLSPAEQVRRQT